MREVEKGEELNRRVLKESEEQETRAKKDEKRKIGRSDQVQETLEKPLKVYPRLLIPLKYIVIPKPPSKALTPRLRFASSIFLRPNLVNTRAPQPSEPLAITKLKCSSPGLKFMLFTKQSVSLLPKLSDFSLCIPNLISRRSSFMELKVLQAPNP